MDASQVDFETGLEVGLESAEEALQKTQGYDRLKVCSTMPGNSAARPANGPE